MVVFCPRYYQSPSLRAALFHSDVLQNEGLRELPAERYEENQARVYFHESLVRSQPRNDLPHPKSSVLAFCGLDNPNQSLKQVLAQMQKRE